MKKLSCVGLILCSLSTMLQSQVFAASVRSYPVAEMDKGSTEYKPHLYTSNPQTLSAYSHNLVLNQLKGDGLHYRLAKTQLKAHLNYSVYRTAKYATPQKNSDPTEYIYSVGVTQLTLTPQNIGDTKAEFRINTGNLRSFTVNSTNNFSVNSSGLLQSVNVVQNDRSGPIVEGLVQTAANVAALIAMAGAGPQDTYETKKVGDFSQDFGPFDPAANYPSSLTGINYSTTLLVPPIDKLKVGDILDEANTKSAFGGNELMNTLGLAFASGDPVALTEIYIPEISVSLECPENPALIPSSTNMLKTLNSRYDPPNFIKSNLSLFGSHFLFDRNSVDGLLIRVPLQLTVTAKSVYGKKLAFELGKINLPIAQYGNVAVFPIASGLFQNRTQKLTLDSDGCLTALDYTCDSMGENIATTLKNATGGLIPIFTNIFSAAKTTTAAKTASTGATK